MSTTALALSPAHTSLSILHTEKLKVHVSGLGTRLILLTTTMKSKREEEIYNKLC